VRLRVFFSFTAFGVLIDLKEAGPSVSLVRRELFSGVKEFEMSYHLCYL
jgi:hypothetical protein